MIKIRKSLSPQWIKSDRIDPDAEFLIRPLNGPTRLDVHNELSRHEQTGQLLISGRGVLLACKAGLVDWKGVTDENGEPLKFSTDAIEWLPEETLQQLTEEIYLASVLTDDERKNS